MDEEREHGTISLQIIRSYIYFGGGWSNVFNILFIYTLWQGVLTF